MMPFCYMGITGEPYQDIEDNPNYHLKGKDMCVACPSKEGPIPTLGWEAMREGVDDVRYLTTLADLIKKEKDPNKAQKAKKVMDEIISRVSMNPSDALFDLSEDDLQNFRKKITQAIMEVTK